MIRRGRVGSYLRNRKRFIAEERFKENQRMFSSLGVIEKPFTSRSPVEDQDIESKSTVSCHYLTYPSPFFIVPTLTRGKLSHLTQTKFKSILSPKYVRVMCRLVSEPLRELLPDVND